MRAKLIKFLTCVAVLCFLLFMARSMRRDLSLTVSQRAGKSNWELGGVTTVRTLGKDVWEITSETVIRMPNLDRFQNSISRINGPSGYRTIHSPKGEYNDKAKTLTLTDAYGIWAREDGPVDWKTPEARWQINGDVWTFPSGVSAISENYSFDAEEAVMESQQKIHAVNGVIRWWSE